jgi:hypothetical protein
MVHLEKYFAGVLAMLNKRVWILLISIFTIFTIGCANNPSGTEVNNSSPAVGSANLKINIAPETWSSIRAQVTSINFIEVRLQLANLGNSSNPVITFKKAVDISGNSATLTFSALPAKPVLAQVILNNASINGARNLHAAGDLSSGQTTTLTAVPVGSGDATDLSARIMQTALNTPEIIQNAPANLVTSINNSINGITDYNQALNAAITGLNINGLITLAAGNTAGQLVGNGGSTNWTKTASEIFAANDLWTTTPANMQVSEILKQGLGGTGLVAWKDAANAVTAITKINTADGTKTAFVKNPGALSHFLVLPDSSIVAAGFNSKKNTPVIFKWAGTADGATISDAGAESNLAWFNYFDGIASYGTPAQFLINSMIYDQSETIYLILKETGTNKLAEYRVNIKDGKRIYVPGSVLEGLSKVAAANTAMETILQNNSLSETQRVAEFMKYIADDFRNIDGTPNTRSTLESTTLSRLERYTINSYSFTPGTMQIVDDNTIKVPTAMVIDVTRKPGAAGSVSAANIPVDATITWKRYGSEWKIYQGLPYLQSEIGI